MSTEEQHVDASVFSDDVGSKIATQINVRAGTVIDSIQTEWFGSTTGKSHGGTGGSAYIFSANRGEAITSVFIWNYNNEVSGVQFLTSKGRMSQLYGQGKGDCTLWQSVTPTSDGRTSWKPLGGFKGTANGIIRSLEPIPSEEPGEKENREYHSGRIMRTSVSKGGDGGSTFNDVFGCGGPATAHIKQVIVRSGWQVDAIQFLYDNNTKTDRHGGSGGSESTFNLEVGEFITQVTGRATKGGVIESIQFVTNTGKTSDKYGNSTDGEPFTLKPPQDGLPPQMKDNIGLLGFVGRSGAKLDRFQAVWAPAAPITYRLTSIKYGDLGEGVVFSTSPEPYGNSRIVNNSDITRNNSDIFTKTYSVTHTHTLSEESSATLGVELDFDIGVPELDMSGGAKITASVTNTSTVTNGVEETTSFTSSQSLDLTVPPKSILTTTLETTTAQVPSVNWTGTMTVTYYNKKTQDFKVEGTMGGGLSSLVQVTYTTTPITNLAKQLRW